MLVSKRGSNDDWSIENGRRVSERFALPPNVSQHSFNDVVPDRAGQIIGRTLVEISFRLS